MKKMLTLLLAVCTMLTLAACGGKEAPIQKNYTAQEVFDAIRDAYGEDFLPDGDMMEEEFTETYGLNMDEVEEICAQITMISFHPDRLLVVKAKEGKGESVEKTLSAARDQLVENGMWYPANLAKVNASRVLRQGDYVVYMMLGAVDPDMQASEEDAAKFAEEQMEIGVSAFNKLFE